MLRIRQRQLESFETASLLEVIDELTRHVTSFAPRLCSMLTPEELRTWVQHGISAAGGHGFTRRGAARFYLEMALIFGSSFDTDPQYPWAQTTLLASNVSDQAQISEHLHSEALEHLQGTGRLSGDTDVSPLERVDIALLHIINSGIRNNSFLQDVILLFEKVNPVTSGYYDRVMMASLVDHHHRQVVRHFSCCSPESAALMVVCMLELGHRFFMDPLYAWIHRPSTSPISVDLERLKENLASRLHHIR